MQKTQKRGGNAFPKSEETLVLNNLHNVIAEAESAVAPLAVEMLSGCVLKNLCLHSGANEPKWISNDVADGASESSAHRVEFRFAILHARSPHHVLDFAVNWKVDCIEHRNTYETN